MISSEHISAALEPAVLGPVWHDPEFMPQSLPALDSDKRCQLLIVGGGFTGLWSALMAIEQNPDLDIILIEKSFIGDSASGRCGGFIQHYLAHGDVNAEQRFPDEAERLDQLGRQNLQQLIETLDRLGIDANYEKSGRMMVAMSPSGAEQLNKEYLTAKESGRNVIWFDRESVREQVNSPIIHAGLWNRDSENGVIDPARLCWGLRDALISRGVRIFEQTEFLNLNIDTNGGSVSRCIGGRIKSDKVLFATNAYPNPIAPLRRSVIPVWDYQLATEPLTDEQMERIGWHRTRHALVNQKNMFHYFRLTADNRITWGGGGAIRYYFNRGTDRQFENADECYRQLAKEFFEMFPQLEDVKFSHKWGGIIASSTRFCMVPGTAFEGRVAWCVGYTGLGVGASRFGARVALEHLGYLPNTVLNMKFISSGTTGWAPEPIRWLGVRMTQRALIKADRNNGKRGLWLKILDKLNLGFSF